MKNLIRDFCLYIASEKGLSPNTIEAYQRDLKGFVHFLGDQSASEINLVTPDRIVEYLALLKERNYATSSVSRALIAIKVFFRFLKREGVVQKNVSLYVDTPKLWQLIPSVLSYREVELLFRQPNPDTHVGARDLAILEVIYSSGLRVSELCNLKLYDLDEDFVRVFGKGRKERIVPVGRKAVAAVDKYLLYYRCEHESDLNTFLFLTQKGRPIHRIFVWKMIKFYAKKAKITKNISPHTLRHSFATHLLDNGANLRVIQDMMGHANISSTDRYLHISKAQVQASFDACHPRK